MGNTITVEAMTHVHYDQSLQTAGPVNHYEIVNWTEDNLSHDTPGAAEQFLVAGPKELILLGEAFVAP